MNSSAEQDICLRWFQRLFTLPLEWAIGASPRVLAGAPGPGRTVIDREAFFTRSGLDFESTRKLTGFEPDSLSRESLDVLEQVLSPEDTVIGYELSRPTRIVLDRLGIKYVDVWLHPVRFYDDVFFAFGSNDSELLLALTDFSLDERLLRLRAREVELYVLRQHLPSTEDLSPGTALFIGQTRYDKALMHQGTMLSLLDFREQFEQLASDYAQLLYCRHPMVHAGDKPVIDMIKSTPSAKTTTTPTYQLLANQNVSAVFSISSSVVHEARYFDKHTEYFFRPPVPLTEATSAAGSVDQRYLPVLDDFLTPQFWVHVLKHRAIVADAASLDLPRRPGRMRETLNLVYGYKDIDITERLRHRLWWALDLKGVVSRRLRAVLSGLRGLR